MKYCICVDGSDHSTGAVRFVASLLREGDSVTLLTAHIGSGDDIEKIEIATESNKNLIAELSVHNSVQISMKSAFHPRSIPEAVSLFADGKFDVIAMGTRGLGKIARAFLGSVSGTLVHSIQDSLVLVVPLCTKPIQTKRVLMCTDGSDPSLMCAIRMSQICTAQDEIVLVGVYDGSSTPDHVSLLKVAAQHGINQARETLEHQQFAGRTIEVLLQGSPPGRTIINFINSEASAQRGFSLVGLGSRGLGKIDRLSFGSTTDSLVNDSSIAVLISH